jgi:hypothetical protein
MVSGEVLRERRERIEAFFVPENTIEDTLRSDVSPSGKYRLTKQSYRTEPKRWNFSRGLVYRLADNEIIADVKRNYEHFWHAWVEHSNGNEYLLCGDDYQGYTVINLTQETMNSYLPPEALKGYGFCWVVVHPSPDGLTLAVDGCYWAAPYELVLYDFSDPSTLPLPEFKRFEGIENVIGWEDNIAIIFECHYDTRASDGVKYSDLSPEEQHELDAGLTPWGSRRERIRWVRGGV